MINRKQKVVLKELASSLADINAWFPQGFTFGPFLSLNDLAGVLSNAKLFADATLLFCVVCNVNTADEVSSGLVKINKWA